MIRRTVSGSEEGSRSPAPHEGERRALAGDAALELAILAAAIAVAAGACLHGRWANVAGIAVPLGPRLLAGAGLLALASWRARRAERAPGRAGAAPGRWLAWLRRADLPSLAVFLLVLELRGPLGTGLGADGLSYLGQLHGALVEGRLDRQAGVEPGVALLMAPFFLLGRLLEWLTQGAGTAAPLSSAYHGSLRLGAAAWALVAALLARRACSRVFAPALCGVCVAGLWLASPLLHYSTMEPAMAHAPGAAAASLVFLLWLKAREEPARARTWLALAVAGGLLVSIQRYDAYLLLPPALTGGVELARRWRSGRLSPRQVLAGGLLALGALLLGLLPLVAVAASTSELFLVDARFVASRLLADWRAPHVGGLLFSSNGGLLAWTPVAWLSLAGLALMLRRERWLGLQLLATLALGVYLLASTPTWSAGWSFGARRLTEAYPLLALGLCAAAAHALARPALMGVAILGALGAWNVLLSRQVEGGRVPRGDTISFPSAVAAAIGDLYARAGHPPSWPAPWIFARVYGVPPDRFDRAYGLVPRDRWELRLDEARPVMGRGWAEQGRATASGPWARGREATLLVSVRGPAPHVMTGTAVCPPGAAPQQHVRVLVNGQAAGVLVLRQGESRWAVRIGAGHWRRGLNEIRFDAAWALTRGESQALGVPPFAAWQLREWTLARADP
jgi:hypothetical protein